MKPINYEMKRRRAQFVDSCFGYYDAAAEKLRTIRAHEVQSGDTISLDGQELHVVGVERAQIFPDTRVALNFGSWSEEIVKDVLVTLVRR